MNSCIKFIQFRFGNVAYVVLYNVANRQLPIVILILHDDTVTIAWHDDIKEEFWLCTTFIHDPNDLFKVINPYILIWQRAKVYDSKLKVNWEFRNVYIVDNVRVRVVSRILTDGSLVYTLFTNCIWLINFIYKSYTRHAALIPYKWLIELGHPSKNFPISI